MRRKSRQKPENNKIQLTGSKKEQDIVLCSLTDETGEKVKISQDKLQNQSLRDTIHTSYNNWKIFYIRNLKIMQVTVCHETIDRALPPIFPMHLQY